MPPKWTPLSNHPKLKEDRGVYYRDINAASYPDHPLEPTVEAIMRMTTDSASKNDKMQIDILGCASTLGNLLQFAMGAPKDFRILVEVVGNTVHLVRREKAPTEVIPDVRGFGHTFPESYTTWDRSVGGSFSHQRVISYQFGDLACVVRFEGDGYLPDRVGKFPARVKTAIAGTPNTIHGSDDVSNLVSSLSMAQNSAPSSSAALQIGKGGCLVPQTSIFDLKTRSTRYKPKQYSIISGEIPRIWVRQIPSLILAYHTSGVFNDIQVRDMRGEVTRWEKDNQNSLKIFEKLLKAIISFARRGNAKFEISYKKTEEFLCFREQTADVKPALSASAERSWKEWLGREANEATNAEYYITDRAGIDYTACDEECNYCGCCAD